MPGELGEEGSAGCQVVCEVPTTIAKKVGSETVDGLGWSRGEWVVAEAGRGVQCSLDLLCEGLWVLSTEPRESIRPLDKA